MTAPTVVSTSPSGTEISCALGVEPAAVSTACDHPPSITDRPRIDRSRVTGETSAERDRSADAVDQTYDVDADLLRRLEPDLVLTQSVCGVCALDETRVHEVLADVDADPDVLGLNAASLADVLDCIEDVGAALGREHRAQRLVDQLARGFDRVGRATADADRPRVVAIEWLDPIHVAANWVPDVIERAGGRYPLADAGERSTTPDWNTIREAAPDVLLVAPCSFSVAEARERRAELTERPGWDDIPAVRNDRVYAVDGRALSRWTPRLAGECTRIASALHPEQFGGCALEQF